MKLTSLAVCIAKFSNIFYLGVIVPNTPKSKHRENHSCLRGSEELSPSRMNYRSLVENQWDGIKVATD